MSYQLALITGASSGIGEAFAHALPATTGLLLTGRDEARLSALRESLGSADRKVETLAADLGQEAGRAALLAAAERCQPDLLINNAGLGFYGPFLDNAPEAEREMVEVNVTAPLVLTRALLPGMLERARATGRRAGLILVSSTAAFMALPYFSTYAATKAFDLSLAEGLAGELRKEPIDVLGLCPGATATRFFERSGMAGSSLPIEQADEAATVAREGLAALGRQTTLVIGRQNKAMTMLAQRLPREMVRRGTRSFMRRGLKPRRA